MIKKDYNVIIIGGGAAGLICGYLIKSMNDTISVAILEAQNRVGKKLMVTGNGRCNMTNINLTEDMYHGSIGHGVASVLNKCTPELLINTFNNMGLMTTVDSEGRVYPLSKQANSVLDILRLNLNNKGVDIYTDSYAESINKHNGTFIVSCKDKAFTSEKLIVATGGKASPSTGSDVGILNVLEKLGHSITPLSPALCPVKVKSDLLKSLKGIRVIGEAKILHNNKIIKREAGEIQFSENALSGICVFNLSRIANTYEDTQISVSLLPDKSFSEIYDIIKNKISLYGSDANAEELMIGFFNKMIGIAILKTCGISPMKHIADFSEGDIKNIAKTINDWRFDVVKGSDFSKAQVTAGGVNAQEIYYPSMESKVVENLYLIGEVLDCDGDCGGMNLHFAFASGYCAACDIAL